MQASNKLTARDFTYRYEPGIGQTYQNGPYLITVGRATYACNYKGRCFSWGHEDFLSAIEACAKHETTHQSLPKTPAKPPRKSWTDPAKPVLQFLYEINGLPRFSTIGAADCRKTLISQQYDRTKPFPNTIAITLLHILSVMVFR